jgi:hypothetical protein
VSLPKRAALALLGFCLLTALVFRPSVSELTNSVPIVGGKAADALLLMWTTSHVSQSLFENPFELFHGGIFHPAPYTVAYSEHMIGQAVLGLPIWLATKNPVLEFNLLSLLSYALAATALFLYASRFVSRPIAALAGGVAFAFTPFRFQHAMWLQLLLTFAMPLSLIFWTRFTQHQRTRDWVLWVTCWTIHSLSGMYLSLLFAVTMGVLSLYGLVAAPARRQPRLWIGTLLAPVAVLAAIAPTLWPYLRLRLAQGQVRGGVDSPFLSLLLPGVGTLSERLLPLEGFHALGPGLVVTLLALAGIGFGWRAARGGGERERFLFGANLIGLAVGLGLCALPMRAYLALPVLDSLRVTNRAFPIALLFGAVFAAQGIDRIADYAERWRAGRAVAFALLALVLLDMGAPRRERLELRVGSEIPAPYRWLRDQPGDAALWERGVLGGDVTPELSMYYAIYHGKPLLGGTSGYVSPSWTYVQHRLARFPELSARQLLDALGVKYALWHFRNPALVGPFLNRARVPGVELAARFESAVILRLTSPPATASSAPRATAPLPSTDFSLAASGSESALSALVDGDPDTAWRIAPEPNARPWLRVDFDRSRAVAGVRSIPAAANAPGIFRSRVEVSNDGTNWERLEAAFEPASLRDLIERPVELAYYQALFPTRRVRHLRLSNQKSATRKEAFEMAELEILADCAVESLPGCPTHAPPPRGRSGS